MISRAGLVTLLFLAATAPCIAGGTSVGISVIRNGKPVEGAAVFVQSLADKNCVKLFREKNPKSDTAERVKACTRDLPEQLSDANGAVVFTDLKPGWYAVHILFLFEPAPTAYQTACQYGDIALMVSGRRDSTGKYNAMAQRDPFELKPSDDVKQQFRFDQALGANGKCLTFP